MHILTVASGKGGVGKTTVAFELAHLLSETRRVVALDIDPQASLTAFFGVDAPDMADVLTGARLARDALTRITDTLSLIGADGGLVSAELVIAAKPIRREETLKRVLSTLAGLADVIVIDTPPALGLLTLNALVASDGVLVVTLPEAAALGTLRATLASVEQVQEINPSLKLLGVLANGTAGHLNHHAHAIEAMQAERLHLLSVSIPRTIALANMAALHEPINQYDKSHPAAAAFRELSGVILKWLKQTK